MGFHENGKESDLLVVRRALSDITILDCFGMLIRCAKHFTRKIFPRHGFFTRGAKMKALCYQRFVFGQPRANNRNCRREDAPRIPLGD